MPKHFTKFRSDELKKSALERIKTLFSEAETAFKDDRDGRLANRYVALARRLSMKFKVAIPRALKRRFCKHCYHYLVPGVNCRVRLTKHKVVYYCLDCKKFMRYPYLREIKAKRMARKNKC